jgi:serine/threonine protein kinase
LKVFDFGLCKTLTPSLKARDEKGKEVYGFNLTPRTGSIPFMAPEVAECNPYDTQCDVFSFAVLLWEIMSLKPVFDNYSRREFYLRVVKHQERPVVPPRSCPPLVRVAVKEGWDHDPQKRPNMKRMAALIRGDLNDLTNDPTIRDRTTHMKNRSSHSQRNIMRSLTTKSSHGL